jgi:hypothetical protein
MAMFTVSPDAILREGAGNAELLTFDRQQSDSGIDDGRLDLVERADERCDEAGCGKVVHLERRADLLDLPATHHHNPVGQSHRLFLIVGDVNCGDAELALNVTDLLAERGAYFGIERRERLVEQQQFGLDRQRPRQRDPLLLPAG